MRFTSLRLSNFRGTRELEIGFEPDVTVIVGRNGAGKSSILDALAMIIGLARSRSRETGLVGVGFQPYAQDVRGGADSARLEIEYEIGEGQSSTPISNILAVGIDSYGGPPDLRSLQDTEALARFASSQPRLIYYRQERGFASGRGAKIRESTADLLDPDAVQDHSLQKDLQAISDLGEWWDQRDAQEARRVRDGERDYRRPAT